MCGEHKSNMPATGASTGSSPRVRGTLAAQGGVAAVGGIIPACAGTPCYRRRGSDRNGIIPACAGTPCYRRRGSDRNGIIPACAGNTGRRCGCHEHVRDHPRVCGEHPFSSIVHNPPGGSSPRVRGTQIKLEETIWSAGIIPACAGNTAHMICLELPTRDHPRVCGEHMILLPSILFLSGSSPRVRGTRGHARCFEGRAGIIPACAGNTCKVSSSVFSAWDHPRVCGEHKPRRRQPTARPGSSPRVRGTPMTWAQIDDVAGIIPACAGNTCLDIALFVVHWDHPRVCGEHWKVPTSIFCSWGSSPRVRGTPEI